VSDTTPTPSQNPPLASAVVPNDAQRVQAESGGMNPNLSAGAKSTAIWSIVASVLLALVMLCLVLIWRTSQQLSDLERELVLRQQDSGDRAAEARMLAKQAQEGTRDATAKLALLQARVGEVAVQRTQLEDMLQSLARSRDESLLVDIEAAIRVALQQSAITGSAEPLVATLKQSDERLARYNQLRLEGVRRAIARDLDRVKSMRVSDLSALTLKLDEVVRLIDDMPLLGPPESAAQEAAAQAAPKRAQAAASSPVTSGDGVGGGVGSGGFANFLTWQSAQQLWQQTSGRIWNEARSLVRVTRTDQPDAMLLAPDQAVFLRENLKLRLLNARLALLSRQFETAQMDLLGAQAALERYFDRKGRRAAQAAEVIKQVAAQVRQVGLPRPDDTLAAIAAAAAVPR
jgi:uroporphyrin-III C-methyltransferase